MLYCCLKEFPTAFELIFHQIQSFYYKSHFYSSFKQCWVIKSSKPILEKIEQINYRSNAKAILTFEFFTLYTKLPHFDLVSVLNNIIGFAFKDGNKNSLIFLVIQFFRVINLIIKLLNALILKWETLPYYRLLVSPWFQPIPFLG